jgi:hypothetical protein
VSHQGRGAVRVRPGVRGLLGHGDRPGRQGGSEAVGGAASAGDWGLTKSGSIHRAPVVPLQEAAVAE